MQQLFCLGKYRYEAINREVKGKYKTYYTRQVTGKKAVRIKKKKYQAVDSHCYKLVKSISKERLVKKLRHLK